MEGQVEAVSGDYPRLGLAGGGWGVYNETPVSALSYRLGRTHPIVIEKRQRGFLCSSL